MTIVTIIAGMAAATLLGFLFYTLFTSDKN